MIVYTTLFGKTDPLHEPLKTEGARFVCFTDQPIKSENWEIVQVPETDTPTRLSRSYKITPHLLFPDENAWLWMDCCFTLNIAPALLLQNYTADITTFRHPDRNRVTDEGQAVADLHKALPSKIFAQLDQYNSEGFDTEDNPMDELSCNGVILRRNTPEIRALNDLWLEQIQQHTLRDQLSIDYCLWKLGITPARWLGSHRNCTHFTYNHYKRPVNDY